MFFNCQKWAKRFIESLSFFMILRVINLDTALKMQNRYLPNSPLIHNNSPVPLTERQRPEGSIVICNVNEWDAGTNWQFQQTVNVYQDGTLCKLTWSLYPWLQSSGGAEMSVWREELLVCPVNACLFTTVIWEQRQTRCECVRFVCPCLNAVLHWSRGGFPVTVFADPDIK